MERKRAGFWVLLALINVAGLGYAFSIYARANEESRPFAIFVLLAVIFILAVADIRSALPR